MDPGALDTHDNTKVSGEPGNIIPTPTITAGLVGGEGSDVVDQGALELHQTLVLPGPPVVLEGAI